MKMTLNPQTAHKISEKNLNLFDVMRLDFFFYLLLVYQIEDIAGIIKFLGILDTIVW
jgi:hypothetical protein